jgi:hypothetical protein
MYDRVMSKNAPRSAAIKMKCAECNGWEAHVERTKNCTVVTCPLHPYRPGQKKVKNGTIT